MNDITIPLIITNIVSNGLWFYFCWCAKQSETDAVNALRVERLSKEEAKMQLKAGNQVRTCDSHLEIG